MERLSAVLLRFPQSLHHISLKAVARELDQTLQECRWFGRSSTDDDTEGYAMRAFDHMRYLAQAGANILHLASYEWERVRGYAIGLANALELPLMVWSQSTGLLAVGKDGEVDVQDGDETDPMNVLRSIHGADEAGVWLLEDFQPFLREEHHPLLRWLREIARQSASPRKLVILSTPLPGLPMDLRKEVPTIELELPAVDDLRVVLEDAAEALGVEASDDEALLDAA